MGSRVKMNCPACDNAVELKARFVTLSLDDTGEEGSYSFRCPKCETDVVKVADQTIVKLLKSADVQIEGFQFEGDWDGAFLAELTCGDKHRWDFPVKLGQKCLCGEKEWGGA